MYGLGKLTKKGIPILAKTGFYFNSEGSYLSKSQDKWYNHFWQQGKASTNGSRSHARPSSFPIEPYVRRLPCFA